MAEMTLQLRIDPVTGKKDLIIALRGDDDSLPHEHEQRHQALVDKLIEGGLVAAGDFGQIIVERLPEEGQIATPVSAPPLDQRRAEAQGE